MRDQGSGIGDQGSDLTQYAIRNTQYASRFTFHVSRFTVGLIGWPVGHSLSPAMQNAAFGVAGLDWSYSLWPTPPEALAARVARLREAGVAGANVTVPHKTAVLPWLDEIQADAEALGAVNTIV